MMSARVTSPMLPASVDFLVPVTEPSAKHAATTTTHIAIARHGWVALQRAARTVICPLAIPSLPLCAPSGAPPQRTWRGAGYGTKASLAGTARDHAGSPLVTPGADPTPPSP